MATHSGPDLCHAEMIIPVFDLQQRLSASFSLIRRPSVVQALYIFQKELRILHICILEET